MTTPIRVEVGLLPHVRDVVGLRTARKIHEELGLDVRSISVVKVYTIAGLTENDIAVLIDAAALHDPVVHTVSSTVPLASGDFNYVLEVGLRPGVTDNEGRTARSTALLVLGIDPSKADHVAVYTSTQYLISGDISRDDAKRIGKDLLANDLIQRIDLKSREEWDASPGFPAKAAKVTGEPCADVAHVDLAAMSDNDLMNFSRQNTLALSLEEMQTVRDYYRRPEVMAERKRLGLPDMPTDAEIETLAQTWSEHCKHKIFTATINYVDTEMGSEQTIKSLFKTYIQGSTETIRNELGDDDFCLSVFKDNAGVIRFTEDTSICVKVETHNSPSALDPYGGALTGIVGVNRDPMGTGIGANMVCNTDVFCFASPFYDKELPPRLLHPRRVLEGVREGVEHGGNKSGIPTVNGSLVFDERYLGKPLVFCGTIGMMPLTINGKPSHEKKALPGDAIVMTGGRIGKDGIHGATFSSEELHEGSPATAVQIGDPITQRKMYDFLMRCRDLGLYNAITDDGAGGLSSSVGEMAQDSGGCDMDLSKAPLKYDGLRPWEILLSEAQERMTLAVPQDKLGQFMDLAKEMDVEATELGQFTDSGYFHVTFGDTIVSHVDMDFLHDGAPVMQLNAVWERPSFQSEPLVLPKEGHGALLERMLGRLNICSKEYIIRQYDHEVKGGSVVKPLVGVKRDGPADAAVMRPLLNRNEGLVVSHGICPKFSDYDTYWMMALCIDEAVRNAVAVGADPSRLAGVDNFCWCDPVQSEKTPDGQYKLAQLVRANMALSRFCLTYKLPCISGKDSMKNDYTGGGVKISIPPTVLYTVVGVMDDVNKAVTSDFKTPGDLVYLLGPTAAELGGSELTSELGAVSASVPMVDGASNLRRYQSLHASIEQCLVTACHDLSDGGLAVALAEMALAGRLGARVDLDSVVTNAPLSDLEILYSESAGRLLACVNPANKDKFEAHFSANDIACIGVVSDDETLTIRRSNDTLLESPVETLAHAFTSTLNW
ncbi:AIR synthase-related protein [Desulfovibrio inopinatus]|uniref:AIR synthase-related protein n=1 Tax=Desulfovibrio inopinatus TaxID=102109 RepID=UPI000415F72F|nr:AIR synthase-related protein [Desulfovibrio inopinatus]